MSRGTPKFKGKIEFRNNTLFPIQIKKYGDITEKQLEELVIKNLNKLENGMKFLKAQYSIAGGIIDIIARDKNDILCIIELKVIPDCKDVVFQSLYYPSQFNEITRMIVIAPDLTQQLKYVLGKFNNIELYKYFIDNTNNIMFRKILKG